MSKIRAHIGNGSLNEFANEMRARWAKN